MTVDSLDVCAKLATENTTVVLILSVESATLCSHISTYTIAPTHFCTILVPGNIVNNSLELAFVFHFGTVLAQERQGPKASVESRKRLRLERHRNSVAGNN